MDDVKFLNEEILIAHLKKGDELAYNHLYKLFYQDMCVYITTIGGDDILAQEVVQKSFIKIWKKRKKLLIKKSLRYYLFKVAYHLYIDSRRKKKKEIVLLERLKKEAAQELIQNLDTETDNRIKLIELEINNLPPQCRKVFVLGKKEGLKYREIAEKLKISKKTVEIHMGKALKRIRKKLINRQIPNTHHLFLFFGKPTPKI